MERREGEKKDKEGRKRKERNELQMGREGEVGRDREGEDERMLPHEPSRHALHVNISRSASTEITTLCVCVCGNLKHSLAASGAGFSVLHADQLRKNKNKGDSSTFLKTDT